MKILDIKCLKKVQGGCYCYCYRSPVILGHEIQCIGESASIDVCIRICLQYHGNYTGCYENKKNFDDKEDLRTGYLFDMLFGSTTFEMGDLI